MTEQEKREKAIDEMLSELEMWFDHEPSWLSSKAKALEIIGRLGYRKEEEVIKETAQKIWKYCCQKQYCNDEYIEWSVFLYDIQDICKQCGAEVGE